MDLKEGKVLHARDVADLYGKMSGEWLLIEVLRRGKNGKAELFRLIAHSKNKNHLHDYVLDNESMDWGNHYVMVYADPGSVCEL